jgi:type I restriction enzyme S subunit
MTDDLPTGYKMTELGPLPQEWRVVRLRALGHISSGGSAPQGSEYFGGTHRFVRVQHLDENHYEVRRWDLITDEAIRKYRLRLFPSGTIVFPKSGASIRLEKRAILPLPCYLVSHLCAVVPNTNIVYGDFLLFALISIPLAADKAEGYPTLSLTEIGHHLIPLPPLPEQRAIAHVLRTVQEAKEATERVIAALRELKKSLMRHLFTCGPVPLDAAGNVELRETEIGPIPAHWQVVRLGEVAEKPQYGYTTSATDQPVGPKFLRITDIQEGMVLWAAVPYCAITQSDVERFLLKTGDILVARIGATTGKTFLVTECPPAVFASYLIRVRVPSDRPILPDFLWYYTNTPRYWDQINASKGGRLKQGINIPVLLNLLLPLPPLPEQRAIAETLRAVDRKIEAEQARRQALEALFQALLHDLMTARRRLPPEFVARFTPSEPPSPQNPQEDAL